MNLASIVLARICLSAPLLLGACGNFVALEASDAGLVDASTVDARPIFDAVPAVDADPSLCNPVTQVGCSAGQKCAQLVASDDPFLGDTTCVPDGTFTEGEACSRGPAGPTGFDDCRGGLHCIAGTCSEICDQAPTDTCVTGTEAVFEGATCTLFNNTFEGSLGICLPACDPTDDTVVGGAIDNTDCPDAQGCTLNFTSGATTCSGVPANALDLTQNEQCFGSGGTCFLNGCAAGFAPLLPDRQGDPVNTHCTRYCTPLNTHIGAAGGASGSNGKCANTSLDGVGGRNGNVSEHQCRFVQSFFSNGEEVPAEVGMCVPIAGSAGGSFGDCTALDLAGIRNAWNAEAPNGMAAAEGAIEDFCFIDAETIDDKCLGFFFGCLSLAEKEVGFNDPVGP